MIRFRLKELIADKSYKEGRRINLQEVADATNIHRTTLSKLQSPVGHNTSTDNLDKLCEYFKCEIEELAQYIPDE